MKANRAYELRVNRAGHGPAALNPDRVDSIEVLEIDSGELALFWDLAPHHTGRMARALRADLAQLEAPDFLAKWSRWQAE
ncbi:MAG: hypothetical protein QOE86_599 [Solirubrobacteraceae bacterium]|nr:hypothetical protein [Solirubrobacteraceae bacterium]